MSNGTDKALRGLEAGTKLATLGLVALAGYLLYSFFGKDKKPPRQDQPKALPPTDPSVEQTPEPDHPPDDQGVVLGGAAISIIAAIVSPPANGSVTRNLLSSYFDVSIQLVNQSSKDQDVLLTAIGDFHELTGGDRNGIRTVLGPYHLGPGQVTTINTKVDSGNVHSVLYELGQANATFELFANGELAQSTYFYVG